MIYVVPTQWECKDYADGWIVFKTFAEALEYQRMTGCVMRPIWRGDPRGPRKRGANIVVSRAKASVPDWPTSGAARREATPQRSATKSDGEKV